MLVLIDYQITSDRKKYAKYLYTIRFELYCLIVISKINSYKHTHDIAFIRE